MKNFLSVVDAQSCSAFTNQETGVVIWWLSFKIDTLAETGNHIYHLDFQSSQESCSGEGVDELNSLARLILVTGQSGDLNFPFADPNCQKLQVAAELES